MTRGTKSWMWSVVPAVMARPHLWLTALRQARRLAPTGWWRRFPLLPLPDPGYLQFRMVTMYGGEPGDTVAQDAVAYLEWCRRWPEMSA